MIFGSINFCGFPNLSHLSRCKPLSAPKSTPFCSLLGMSSHQCNVLALCQLSLLINQIFWQ